jgi:hypothetical protein
MARYLSGPTLPYGKWNGIPIYLSTILAVALGLGLIGTAIIQAAYPALLRAFVFAMPLEPPWSLWRAVTYVFVIPINFFTPFTVFFFYWLAVGIETHLGRGVLTRLILLLVAVVPVVMAFWWWIFGISTNTFPIYNYMLDCGLLVAFATLYPSTEFWGWVPFKWVAFACIFCGSLMLMADHSWNGIAELWISCAVGFACVRHAKELEYDDHVSTVSKVKDLFRRKPKFRVVPAPSNASFRETINEPDSELDTLLDKISKSGMDSLTPKERASLQKAREALIRKDQH